MLFAVMVTPLGCILAVFLFGELMRIEVNGSPYHHNGKLTIEDLLGRLEMDRKRGLAVAINYKVVSKSEFRTTAIHDGDKVEIIHATAGG
jgi:sulfur carrier protein